MRADSETHDAIVELITETYRRMSRPPGRTRPR